MPYWPRPRPNGTLDIAHIRKHGGSLGITLNPELRRQLRWERDDPLLLYITPDGDLLITNLRHWRQRYGTAPDTTRPHRFARALAQNSA